MSPARGGVGGLAFFFYVIRKEVLQWFDCSSNGLLIKAFLIIITSLCFK